jgi:hypothetical protein
MGAKLKCGGCGNELELTGYSADDPFLADGSFIICGACSFPNPADHHPADFRFSAIAALGRPYKSIHVKTEALSEVKEAFDRNMDRVVSLTRLPRSLSLHWQFFQAGGPPRVGHMSVGTPKEAAEVRPIWTHMRHDPQFKHDEVYANVSRGVSIGLETLLASMVIGTWTAIETLAGDMWEAAVNCHWQILSALDGKPQDWQNANSSEDRPERSEEQTSVENQGGKTGEKIVPLGRLQRGPKIFKEMGTFLRARYTFQTLPSIRKAYGQAFSQDFEQVREALIHASLDHLAGVRNALVHRAGKADRKFKRQLDGCKHFEGVKEKDLLNLNGAVVCSLVGNALIQAIQLVAAVDKWICDHPQDEQRTEESG